jgi:hypothetical protein
MKIIKITSCCDCPNRVHIIDMTYNPDACNKYVCNKLNRTLATKSLGRVIKPMTVCVPTQSITTGITAWKYTADGKTEWDGSIPDWCQLDNYKED